MPRSPLSNGRRARIWPGNLPADPSSFIGRRAEVAELHELQATTRLLTLVGPGGVGKTRLALRVGAERRGSVAHGAWLVDVAPLSEPDLVPQTVADALGIRERRSESWLQTLVEALRERNLLLILDTCEHQLAACADLARAVLRDCRRVEILATSQEPLSLVDEVVWRVSPLSLPGSNLGNLRHLRTNEAVQLFVSRAADALSGFALTAANALAVVRICRDLDGIPLALELAAGHVASLGVGELAERIHAQLALTLSGQRDAPSRQRTLRAALDWSYGLLSDSERILLRRIAVFAGGWTVDAAQTVCYGTIPSLAVVDVLERLEAKSLVHGVRSGGLRHRLLDVTRQYALAKLEESGEWEQVARRQLEWCVAIAERVPPESLDVAHADGLELEQDNLRAALSWAIATGEAELGLRIAVAAFPLWFFRNHYAEGRTWFDRLLALPTASTTPVAYTRGRAWRAQLLTLLGEFATAEVELEAVLAEQQQRGDLLGAGVSMVLLGTAAMWRGELDRAGTLLSRALAQLSDLGSRGTHIALFQLARIAWEMGDVPRARALIDRLLAIGELHPQPVAIGRAQAILAMLSAEPADPASALHHLADAESFQQGIGDQNGLLDTLIYRGQVLLGAGRVSQAGAAFQEAARAAREAGEQARLLRAVEGIARARAGTNPEIAVQLAASCARKRARMGVTAWPRDKLALEATLRLARAALGPDAYSNAWQMGTSMLDSDVLALALSGAPSSPAAEARGFATLTPREREVLRLLANGASPAQISQRLVISVATVEKHLEHVMGKLGLHSRVQLVKWSAHPHNSGLLWQTSE